MNTAFGISVEKIGFIYASYAIIIIVASRTIRHSLTAFLASLMAGNTTFIMIIGIIDARVANILTRTICASLSYLAACSAKVGSNSGLQKDIAVVAGSADSIGSAIFAIEHK